MLAIQHHDHLPVDCRSVSEAQDADYLYNGLPRFWADDVFCSHLYQPPSRADEGSGSSSWQLVTALCDEGDDGLTLCDYLSLSLSLSLSFSFDRTHQLC